MRNIEVIGLVLPPNIRLGVLEGGFISLAGESGILLTDKHLDLAVVFPEYIQDIAPRDTLAQQLAFEIEGRHLDVLLDQFLISMEHLLLHILQIGIDGFGFFGIAGDLLGIRIPLAGMNILLGRELDHAILYGYPHIDRRRSILVALGLPKLKK